VWTPEREYCFKYELVSLLTTAVAAVVRDSRFEWSKPELLSSLLENWNAPIFTGESVNLNGFSSCWLSDLIRKPLDPLVGGESLLL
jgi:hypothetical protein